MMRRAIALLFLLASTLAVPGCKGEDGTSSMNANNTPPEERLHLAVREGNLAKVQSLIRGGCDIDARDKDGFTPLCTAAMRGDVGIVEFLISQGADVNAVTITGGTALHIAAWKGYVDIARLLIAAGADVNAGKERGQPPLYEAGHLAGEHGHEEVIGLLLTSGAQIIPGDTRQNSGLLCFAVEHGMRDLVAGLLTAGTSPNAKGCGSGRTVLGEAVARGDTGITKLLIDGGADVNMTDTMGFTALHQARRWSREAAELLLAKGADANAPGLLQWAVTRDEKEIVELLLTHGADVNIKNAGGNTPLDTAIGLGHTEIAELLKKYGGRSGFGG